MRSFLLCVATLFAVSPLPCSAEAPPPKAKVWSLAKAKSALEISGATIAGWTRTKIGFCHRPDEYEGAKIQCFVASPRPGKEAKLRRVSLRSWIGQKFFDPESTTDSKLVSPDAKEDLKYQNARFRLHARCSESDATEQEVNPWSVRLVPKSGPELTKKGTCALSSPSPQLLVTPHHVLFFVTCGTEYCGSKYVALAFSLP